MSTKVLNMFSWCRQYLFARYGRSTSHKCKEASWAVVTGQQEQLVFDIARHLTRKDLTLLSN